MLEEGNIFYVCSGAMKEPMSKKLLKNFKKKEGKWSTFEEFVKWNYGVWVVTIKEEDLSVRYS